MKSKINKQIAIIGAGLGGMSAAIALRSHGYHVDLYEKNNHLGGKLNQLEKDGFTFDLGPSIFTLPQYFRSLFQRAGKNFDDYVKLTAVKPHWRNFFEDGLVLDLYKEQDLMFEELKKLSGSFEQHKQEFLAFLQYSKQQYDIVESGYFAKGLDNLMDFIKHYGLFKLFFKIDHRNKMSQSIDQHFSDPHLKRIFEYFIKYVGSSAIDSPGFMNLMPHIQFEYDLWYVDGGLYNLAHGFEKLLHDIGVNIHLNTEIDRIEHVSNKVTGIQLKGQGLKHYDYVVSNMEVIPAYETLLEQPESFTNGLKKFEPACSGLVLHLGVKQHYPQLAHHNFFYSKDQKKHFNTVFKEKKLPDDPTIYLVAPTRTDASKAPEGCDNIKILPHIPYINDENPYTPDDYVDFKERVLDKLEGMGLDNLRKNTIVEDMWTPLDIQKKYYSNKGSIYGVVSDWDKNYAFKAPKQSKKFKNLFFVGGSVNPGGGMPMVTLCGQNVADQLFQFDQS
ncbi:NAD(P)/FAD-dependent oxidoreductase [bacterium]|nr:NAD(P)/FAD-dependent oxidoreductase [bacterium]